MDKIKDKLLPFQLDHVNNLVRIIQNNKAVLDGSDTGTGKTWSACAVCKILNLAPIIVCPKSVIVTWERVAKVFNLKLQFVVNYETAKLFKFYKNRNRIKCPYLKKNGSYISYGSDEKRQFDNQYSEYRWVNLQPNTIFIFDEVHRATNLTTQNGQLLFAAKLTKYPIIVLSATVADKPEKFKMLFWILNFIDPNVVERENMQFPRYLNIMIKWITRDSQPMKRIYNMLYPVRAARIRIDALGDLFPKTQITAEPYTMGKTREDKIEQEYSNIAQALDELHDKTIKDKSNILVRIMRAHQRIELLKIPTFVELANDLIESGFSVVIFVNFTQTLKQLQNMLHCDVIYGEIEQSQRDKAIDKFQSNKTNIIVCNIKISTGISLHDIHGGHPRASIISPTWNAIDLVQALGRIHRAGGKSKSLQRIVYTANTIEEKIADKLKEKISDITTINNGDLDMSKLSTGIKFITYK